MIRVLLADDENLIRTALASLLAIQEDLEVVAQAASGEEALVMARRHRPDVAVLDLQMPGLDGIAVAQKLVTELPACGSLIRPRRRNRETRGSDPRTVRNYLSSAAAKLGAANRHEAVQLARSRGWI